MKTPQGDRAGTFSMDSVSQGHPPELRKDLGGPIRSDETRVPAALSPEEARDVTAGMVA